MAEQSNGTLTLQVKPSMIDEFVKGAKKGFYVAVENITPAMVLAYALILFLNIIGVMPILAKLLGPIMAVFGLPGEAMVVLTAAFFAKAAGCATAATLYSQGVITATQATILFPACITMGTLVGNFVRVVMVSQTNIKWQPLLLCSALVDAAVVMWLTRFALFIMGVS
ncbi:spore maturation protein SpmB [Sporomusaceae bacterium BoRhaA]|uniref:nucleoside recognition domain-containing protein n=1 Tax=Pelorhabdus rhamnosifermentans TaxID=2772457 RepID=UPI001C0610E5|nr:nucleoside recognition domain-containing protein [Pelorhabdus rhamnosifermentans]MBU2702411.1 spore maturation protein SpmB [Pelorhabdus rhamnosifermentans]